MKTTIEITKQAGLHLATDVNWMPIIGLAYAEKLIALVRADERKQVAAWMMQQGYATGHGDTVEDLLEEFKREASFDRAELWIKRINDAVLAEREACAKVAEKRSEPGTAAFIRARGQT
jgi:hypothetical protein